MTTETPADASIETNACTVCESRFQGSGLRGVTCSRECARVAKLCETVAGVAIIIDNLENAMRTKLDDLTLTVGQS